MLRFVLYKKVANQPNVVFAYEDRSVESLDPVVAEYIGSEPAASHFFPDKRMRIFARGDFLLEVYMRPRTFQAGRVDGGVFGKLMYRRVATMEEVRSA